MANEVADAAMWDTLGRDVPVVRPDPTRIVDERFPLRPERRNPSHWQCSRTDRSKACDDCKPFIAMTEREVALERAYKDLDRIDWMTGVTAWTQAYESLMPDDPASWWKRYPLTWTFMAVVSLVLFVVEVAGGEARPEVIMFLTMLMGLPMVLASSPPRVGPPD